VTVRPETVRKRKRNRSRAQILETVIEVRKSLARVSDHVKRTRRDELDLGGAVPVSVRLTDEERVQQLTFALVWLQRAENEMPKLRTLIQRQLDTESKEAF
jgi:hypothetical protein